MYINVLEFWFDFKVSLNQIREKRIVILNSLRHCIFVFYNSEPVCNAWYLPLSLPVLNAGCLSCLSMFLMYLRLN